MAPANPYELFTSMTAGDEPLPVLPVAQRIQRGVAAMGWAFALEWVTAAIAGFTRLVGGDLGHRARVSSYIDVSVPPLLAVASGILLAGTLLVSVPEGWPGTAPLRLARGASAVSLAASVVRAIAVDVWGYDGLFGLISDGVVPRAFAACCWYGGCVLGALDVPGAVSAKAIAVAIALVEGGGELAMLPFSRTFGGGGLPFFSRIFTAREIVATILGAVALILAERIRCVLELRTRPLPRPALCHDASGL
jgi:hypothetical protein